MDELPALQCGPIPKRTRDLMCSVLIAAFCLLGVGVVILVGAISHAVGRCIQP